MARERPSVVRQWKFFNLGSSAMKKIALVATVVFFLFQLYLFSIWTVLPHISESSSKFLIRRNADPTSGDSLKPFRKEMMDAFKTQEDKLSHLSSGLLNNLRERESVLVGIAVKLQQRENELVLLENKLTQAMENMTFLKSTILASNDAFLTNLSLTTGYAGKAIPPTPLKCRRLREISVKKQLKWTPEPDKFLLVMCTGGQLSNRMSCLRQHMLDAALLNRTLIFPSQGVDYDFEILMDLQQPAVCFGNDTFMTLNNYLANQPEGRRVLNVDRFICHVHKYQRNEVCNSLMVRYSGLGIRFKQLTIPSLRTTGPWDKYTAKEFLGNFSYSDRVIAFGNMFGVSGKDLRFHGVGPIKVSESCRFYLTPSRPILRAATGFVNTFLGSNFMAVHLRRGDFFQHCTRGGAGGRHGKFACFYPLRQVANCLSRRLEESPHVRVVFLATNGNDQEIEILNKFMGLLKKPIPIVRILPGDRSPWIEPLKALKIENNSDVLAMVEKTVCVLSSVFHGTAGSTFSGDIGRLRDWWLLKTCNDGNLCGNEDPDTIPMF